MTNTGLRFPFCRLLAEMPDTFVSYLTRNGGSKASKQQLNVVIGGNNNNGSSTSGSTTSSQRSSPSPTNSCARSRIPTKKPIRMDQFGKYYEENMKDSCYGFMQEFDILGQLCRETLYKQTMIKSQNMKNRFANILPCEFCANKKLG